MCIDRSVYGFRTSGFGDVWAQVNYMLHYPPLIGVNPVVGGYDLTSVIRDIESNLCVIYRFNLVDFEPTYIPEILETYSCVYFPTVDVWSGKGSGTICYQFDGNSEVFLKCLTDVERNLVLDFLGRSYRLIDVGGNRSLSSKVRDLQSADAFVGIPSGLSHVANSVGLPVLMILREALLRKYGGFMCYRYFIYQNKPNMVFYRGVKSFIKNPNLLESFEINRTALIDHVGDNNYFVKLL